MVSEFANINDFEVGTQAPADPPGLGTRDCESSSPRPEPGEADRRSCPRQSSLHYSPLEGESQKPSRQATADAVGGASSLSRRIKHRHAYPATGRSHVPPDTPRPTQVNAPRSIK